jgi:ABC-type glycerol-3-phosphate transport system substrate-binding protein
MVRALLVAVLLALAAAGCGGSTSTSEAPPPTTSGLADLTAVEQLRGQFNEKQGVPRLVLLLSPT